MDEKKIRQYLKEKHGLRFSDKTWRWLFYDDRRFEDVSEAELDEEELLAGIRGLAEDQQRERDVTATATVRGEGRAADVRRRAEVYSFALGRLADQEEDVVAFRGECLPEGHLSEEEARRFVTSPALARFSSGELWLNRVPLRGHTAELGRSTVEREKGRLRERAAVTITPPGSTLEAARWRTESEIPGRPPPPLVRYPGKIGAHARPVWSGSVLDGLREVAVQLARRFPWEEADATWFVMTGKAPSIPPVRATFRFRAHEQFSHEEIGMWALPWVPVDYVQQSYHQLRQESLKGRERVRERGLTERALEVFRFVLEQLSAAEWAQGATKPAWGGWTRLFHAWNTAHPEWQYSQIGGFWNAYQRAHKAILDPPAEGSRFYDLIPSRRIVLRAEDA